MSTFDPNAGFTGTPDPLRFAWGQQAIEDARRAAQGASLDLWPDADFIFIDPLTGQPRLPQAIEDVAPVTRESKSWSDGWSGVNGDPAGPLIEHASGKASWAPSGLTVSPAVENLIFNPRVEGAVSWGYGTSGGTITNLGGGNDDGWPYIALAIDGVSTGGYVYFAGAAVSSGEPLSGHIGVSLVSGSMPGGQSLIVERAGIPVGSGVSFAPDALHRRWGLVRTAPDDGSYTAVTWLIAPGTYSNAVVRLYAPQLTKTAYPARPVLPPAGTPGAATRAAESVTVPVVDWYRHDAGTLVVEYDRSPLNDLRGIAAFPVNNYYGRALLFGTGLTQVIAESYTEGGAYGSAAAAMAAGRHISALRWNGTAHRAATDGVLTAAWTHAGAIGVPTVLSLGAGGSQSTAPSSTPLHRVRFFPRALSDAEMIDVTTPYWSA